MEAHCILQIMDAVHAVLCLVVVYSYHSELIQLDRCDHMIDPMPLEQTHEILT